MIRYLLSRIYFARLRVAGKLIRKSLKTDGLSVVKLRPADLEKSKREAVETRDCASKGRMTFGDCLTIFQAQTDVSNLLKPSAKHYRREVCDSILKSWPGLQARDVRQVSASEW